MMGLQIAEINCGYPVGRYPYYYADARVENDLPQNYCINKLWVNGKPCRDYVIFQGDRYVYNPLVESGRTSTVIARADWATDDEIRVEMELISSDGKDRKKIARNCRTPSYGGYWNPKWKYYFSLDLCEEDGLCRHDQPVHATVSLYADRVTDIVRELRLVEINPLTGVPTEVPCQVSEVHACRTEPDVTKQPSVSFDVAFYANLWPHESKVYVGFYGNPDAPAPTYGEGLTVTGTGYARILENEYYRVKLHPKSGVLDEIDVKMGRNKTFLHKLETNGAIHWNPGIYQPPRAWTHTSDWDPPEGSHYDHGPIFSLVQVWGQLPLYGETMVSITYILYAKAPFLRMSSVYNILKDIDVQAMRNGEIVLTHDLAREFAWRNRHGEINSVTVKSLPRFAEIPLTIAACTPWTAYYSNEHRVGLGSMTLNFASMRSFGGLPKLEKFEQMMNWGPWTYVSRTLAFPFGSQNPQRLVFIPGSSTYFEDMAFMPFAVRESNNPREKFAEMEDCYQRLTNPLSLIVEMDTDKRVPAEFVLGERLEGRIKETEDSQLPIELDPCFTRFRQSPVLLNERSFRALH